MNKYCFHLTLKAGDDRSQSGISYRVIVKDLVGNLLTNQTRVHDQTWFAANNLFGSTVYSVEITTVNRRGPNIVNETLTTIKICKNIYE